MVTSASICGGRQVVGRIRLLPRGSHTWPDQHSTPSTRKRKLMAWPQAIVAAVSVTESAPSAKRVNIFNATLWLMFCLQLLVCVPKQTPATRWLLPQISCESWCFEGVGSTWMFPLWAGLYLAELVAGSRTAKNQLWASSVQGLLKVLLETGLVLVWCRWCGCFSHCFVFMVKNSE